MLSKNPDKPILIKRHIRKSKRIISSITVITLFLTLTYLISACEKKGEERYKDPPWLGGSILETLESDSTGATYEIYNRLLEKAGYVESIQKGLYTVFVANDEAYQEFFDENGIGSVEDVSDETATNYITLNILESPRARHQIIYAYHFGVWQGEGSELGALTYRIPTRSQSKPIKETVRYFEPLKGMEVNLNIDKDDGSWDKYQKFVPLFSTEFFRDYAGATDGSDYTYFFPETEWTGLQWYNANIFRKEVRCSNGYIYYLDKAVPYIPSIEEFFIANEDKYGVFYDAMQRFVEYQAAGFDDDFNRVFNKSYRGITDISPEYGPTFDYVDTKTDVWSILAPRNEVLQQYLDENILTYYPTLDSVPEVTLIYLLETHIFRNFLLPSKMLALPVFDAFGDQVLIDPYEGILEKKVLSNSAFFGIDYVMEPLAFQAVTRPLFFNSEFSTFLWLMFESGLIPSISKADIRATIIAPTNENLEAYGIRYDDLNNELQWRQADGVWIPMTNNEITDFVQGHIIYKDERDYTGEGYQKLESGDHIYYKNNVVVAGGNTEAGDVSNIIDAEDSEFNGILYHIDNVVKPPEHDAAIMISKDPDLSEFFALLDSAGLLKFTIDPITLENIPEITFLAGAKQVTGFIPNNSAVIAAAAAGQIPVDQAELQDFLKYHFLIEQAVFDDAAFSGSSVTARFEGFDLVNNPIYSPLLIQNAVGDLKVTDHSLQTVSVPHSTANSLVKLGTCHHIGQVLIY